jgi:hypothetical protein
MYQSLYSKLLQVLLNIPYILKLFLHVALKYNPFYDYSNREVEV